MPDWLSECECAFENNNARAVESIIFVDSSSPNAWSDTSSVHNIRTVFSPEIFLLFHETELSIYIIAPIGEDSPARRREHKRISMSWSVF